MHAWARARAGAAREAAAPPSTARMQAEDWVSASMEIDVSRLIVVLLDGVSS